VLIVDPTHLGLKMNLKACLATVSLLFSATVIAEPPYSSLATLPGNMEGALLISSNNPESVSRQGLVLSTDQMTPAPNDPQHRYLNNTNYGQGCPAGTLKEFAFYMHHLNQLGAGARYYVLIEPGVANTSVTFNAYGAAISQKDTAGSLDPGMSPSYKVGKSLILGRLAEGVTTLAGSGFVNLQSKVINTPYPLVNLQANQSSSLDARIKVRALSCVRVKVVATNAANGALANAVTLSNSYYAWGNVATTAATEGGAPCTNSTSNGWGRSAGVYEFERWAGIMNVSINSPDSTQGWKYLAAPTNREVDGACIMSPQTTTPSGDSQRSLAKGYYFRNLASDTEGRDSDPWSSGNYGVEYKLGFNVENKSGRCVTAKLQLRSFPGTRACNTNPPEYQRTRNYDGAFRVTQNGIAQAAPVRAAVRCPAGNGLPDVASIATKILRAGEVVRWDIQTFVPGLISLPAAFLIESSSSACQ
jgi:hypothetical protein